jgi:putative acetyltransferase
MRATRSSHGPRRAKCLEHVYTIGSDHNPAQTKLAPMRDTAVSIRPATPSDLVRVAEIHRDSVLALCSGHYDAAELAEWTSVLRPEAYALLLSLREMYVAEADGELVGFGVLGPADALIHATYVTPGAARRGVGRALIARMEEAARGRGCGELHLNATLNAVSFYERLGYVRGADAKNRLPSGVELPCVQMHKALC